MKKKNIGKMLRYAVAVSLDGSAAITVFGKRKQTVELSPGEAKAIAKLLKNGRGR